MSARGYDGFRAGIETLLSLARSQLTAERQDRIRSAVATRHDRKNPRRFIDWTEAELLGIRFLAMMRDADIELEHAQVEQLEKLIDTGLERFV